VNTPRRCASATRDEVADVAARYLAPSRAVTVVLGDAARVEAPLSVLTTVERSESDPGRTARHRGNNRRRAATAGPDHAEPAPRTIGGIRPGWPTLGSAARCWVVDIEKGGQALVRDRPDGVVDLVLLDSADAPDGERLFLGSTRTGRRCSASTRRCRRSTAPAARPARRRRPARRP
jgi:hypothetical protein